MCHLFNILLAVLSRVLFFIHGIVTVWRVVAVKGPVYWVLLVGVSLLAVEIAITLKFTKNAEWKWFSPMVFLYLCTVVPSIWVLELSLLKGHRHANTTHADKILGRMQLSAKMMYLEPDEWVTGLEQTMLIVLVIGRWLMPMGHMSREQLSQLLMVYVGLGADILDIFDTFRLEEIMTRKKLVIIGLFLFTWALMQFPLVLTHKSGQERRTAGRFVGGRINNITNNMKTCCPSEVWILLLTVGLQDGPFMCYRVYLMLHEKVLNQLMIFFTCKNILVVLIEFYRIFVVKWEHQKNRKFGDLASRVTLCDMCCRKQQADLQVADIELTTSGQDCETQRMVTQREE
ncbi:transmembrane protein 26 isoform X1 [Hippocampus zosterae]|uniref:transmembrane protein 26 isoform X1 n=1 Tax=Hippocampus zosterae TaxID=109293 RepID=UPI00223DC539|nr:transmembrane protein 26 isoform X1 [Hippocampus zosterae]